MVPTPAELQFGGVRLEPAGADEARVGAAAALLWLPAACWAALQARGALTLGLLVGLDEAGLGLDGRIVARCRRLSTSHRNH